MNNLFNWVRGRKKKIIVLFSVLLSLGIISVSVYAVLREGGDLRSFAQNLGAVRPLCNSHNDCPPNWMYCIGGECYSYTTGSGVGGGCSVDNDCRNLLLHCINGTCQRDVGEPGGCSNSFDCVDRYRGISSGAWSCTNGQCIRLARGKGTYWDGEEWREYGTTAGCILNSDCGPGARCSEYGCHFFANREPCYNMYQCGQLHSDPNKRYVCVDRNGELLPLHSNNEAGTCQEMDVCDPAFISCGPGTHCRPTTFGNIVTIRTGRCFPDDGTTTLQEQPPQGWTDLVCENGSLVERCSNVVNGQRVRYCSDDPSNVVRWNGWRGTNRQRCVKEGELWGGGEQRPSDRNLPGLPSDFFDTSDCPYTGTRILRCSNVFEGQLVSYCSTDKNDPERSVKRYDDWVGPNGEICTTGGMVIASASVQTHFDLVRPTATLPPGMYPAPVHPVEVESEPQTVVSRVMNVFTQAFGRTLGSQECVGDVNGDGVVDREDFKILQDNWYSRETVVDIDGVPVDIDLNSDGIIDILDVRIVVEDFGCRVR